MYEQIQRNMENTKIEDSTFGVIMSWSGHTKWTRGHVCTNPMGRCAQAPQIIYTLDGHTRVWSAKTPYRRFPWSTWVWRRPVDVGGLWFRAAGWSLHESFHCVWSACMTQVICSILIVTNVSIV